MVPFRADRRHRPTGRPVRPGRGGHNAITSTRCWPTTNSTAGTTRCPTRARRRCSTTTSRYGKPPACRTADRPPGTSSSEWGPQLQRVVGDRKIGARLGQRPVDFLDVRRTELGIRRRLLRQVDLDVHRPGHHRGRQLSAGFCPSNGYAAISNDIANEFATGILASTVASTGALVGITNAARFDFGVAPLPTGPGGVPALPDGRGGAGDSRQALRRAKTQRAQVHRIRHQPGQHRLFQPAHRISRRAKVRRARPEPAAIPRRQPARPGGARPAPAHPPAGLRARFLARG